MSLTYRVVTKDGVENGMTPADLDDADRMRRDQDTEFPADAPHRIEQAEWTPVHVVLSGAEAVRMTKTHAGQITTYEVPE